MKKQNEPPTDVLRGLEPGFILTRDGKEVERGTWAECAVYIHLNHCYSLAWALEHEGYRLEAI